MQKANYRSIIYKASSLLSILIHYEDNNFDYLDYEIRSYKRPYPYKEKLLKTELLIFKTVQFRPDKNKSMKNELLSKKISPTIKGIEKDKYEMQLKKYFDFTEWIKLQF